MLINKIIGFIIDILRLPFIILSIPLKIIDNILKIISIILMLVVIYFFNWIPAFNFFVDSILPGLENIINPLKELIGLGQQIKDMNIK